VGHNGELLASARELGDREAFEQVQRGGAAAVEDLADVAPAELGARDRAADQVRLQGAAETFDFGELGHGFA
jgi:hypothetical protein